MRIVRYLFPVGDGGNLNVLCLRPRYRHVHSDGAHNWVVKVKTVADVRRIFAAEIAKVRRQRLGREKGSDDWLPRRPNVPIWLAEQKVLAVDATAGDRLEFRGSELCHSDGVLGEISGNLLDLSR